MPFSGHLITKHLRNRGLLVDAAGLGFKLSTPEHLSLALCISVA